MLPAERSSLLPRPRLAPPHWVPALLIFVFALAAHAADGLTREPAIDREEARRLVPADQARQFLEGEQIDLLPSEQRRRLSQLRQTMAPPAAIEALLRIRALEGYLDYDETAQMIYGPGRTRVEYADYTLEADQLIFDARLQEVQAEGNVVLTIEEDTIYADSLRYNFLDNEGVAYGASGQHNVVYFNATAPTGEDGPPQLQLLSEDESIFRQSTATTCDFKVPHYYVRGHEVVLFPNDRIFFRGATFYVMNVPVFYLPVYSRSLQESSPWFMQLGYNSETGARIRLGYSYLHSTREPSFEDDDEYATRSRGRANLYLDYLTRLGLGEGLDYNYQFEYERHHGELSLYHLSDGDREVVDSTHPGAPPDEDLVDEGTRWRVRWLHRTQVLDDLYLTINVDEFSDPDLFVDVLDLFNSQDQEDRERQVERRARAALTLLKEAYVARVMVDVKDRIGINRYNDFSDPRDDNRDFDLDPFDSLEDSDADGISSDRWGRVSAKLPQVDVATRWLPFTSSAWFYRNELHLYNSLDKALNIVDDEDDAYVQGVEFYQQLMRQWKLSERYTLLWKLGLGFGGADRDENINVDFPTNTFPQMVDGLTFIDRDTWLTGTDDRSLEDINHAYLWGDSQLRLNARFSDSLTGYLDWLIRETTNDFIGDFYASLGNTTFREDLFNYSIREHWLRAGLDYRLARPLITASTEVGYNLVSRSDVYSKEPLAFWHNNLRWANQRQTFSLGIGGGIRTRQFYDPSDPREFEEDKWFASASADYTPIHGRWYTSLEIDHERSLNGRTEFSGDDELTFFTDEDTETDIEWVYGTQLGPKWDTEIAVHWDSQVGGLREIGWMLQRDLHDALAVLEVTMENDEEDADSRDDQGDRELDVRLGVKFKLPDREVAFGVDETETLAQEARQPAVAR